MTVFWNKFVSAAATAVATLAVMAMSTTPADADGAIPDSALMVALRQAIGGAPVLLVRGEFGVRELWDPVLDSSGVQSGRAIAAARARPALFSTADKQRTAPPPPIPWQEIWTLQTQRPQKLRGAIAGGVLGLAVGFMITNGYHADSSDDLRALGLFIGTPVTGVVLGTFLGSMSGTKTIYRVPVWETN